MSAPKVFGREMIASVNMHGRPIYRFAIEGGLTCCIRQRESIGGFAWVGRIEGAASGPFLSEASDSAEASAARLEQRIRALVESLGPLVGWAPLEKP